MPRDNITQSTDKGATVASDAVRTWTGFIASVTAKKVSEFSNDRRGNIAVIFALSIVPALLFIGISIDYIQLFRAKSHIQAAVDASVTAALSAMSNTSQTTADIQTLATNVFNANVQGDKLTKNATATITISGSTVTGTTTLNVSMPFTAITGTSTIPVTANSSGSLASGQKAEVAMMIDLTGSMGWADPGVSGNTKIQSLKAAGLSLLDILYPNGDNANVRTAVAPMADYVNAGSYASTVTGLSSTGNYANGTDLAGTKAGKYTNSYTGVGGGGGGQGYAATSNNSTYSNTYCTGGTQYQYVYDQYGNAYPVATSANSYTSGAQYGYYAVYSVNRYGYAQYYAYYGYYVPINSTACSVSPTSTGKLISCVTERTGSNAYTDAVPASGSYVGAYNQGSNGSLVNYSSDGKCYVAGRELPAIQPLTSSKSTLQAFFNNATPGGGTPGHLGHAWAWYLLSPNWSSIWPSGSQPVAYGTANVKKAAIIMTDGEYNEQYSNNGTSAAQAAQLCTNMKAAGIEVYTIGFGFAANSTAGDGSSAGAAKQLLTACSSGTNHYYFPYDGNALKQAFQTIGQSLTSTVSVVKLTN